MSINSIIENYEYCFCPATDLNDNDIRRINAYIKQYKNKNVKEIIFITREIFSDITKKNEYIFDISFCFSKEDLETLGVENIDDENEICDCTVDLRGEIYYTIEKDLYDILNLEERELENNQIF